MTTVRLALFEKSTAPEMVRAYLTGQGRAYGAFGLDVSVAVWHDDPPETVFVIPAFDERGDVVAGIRMHLRTRQTALPSERNLADRELSDRMSALMPRRPCEFGGGWVAEAYRRTDLFRHVFVGAFGAAIARGCQHLLGSTHEKLLALYTSLGCTFDMERCFAWPDARYKTFVAHMDLVAGLGPGTPYHDEAFAAASCFREGRPFHPVIAGEASPRVGNEEGRL